jgi:hypothetical protein
MPTMVPRFALSLAAAALVLLPASTAAAQDVQYETVTRLDLPGTLGTAVRLATRLGGGSTETVETTYIKGPRMRTDADRSSTIVDLAAGRIINLDHDARTYTVFDLGEMLQRARQAGEELRAARDEQRVSDGDDAHQLTFRFAVDRSNQRQRVAGYDADQYFLTMEVESEVTPEDAAEREQAGTLVLLTEMWTSTAVPAFRALDTFQDASAQQFAEAGSALMEGMAAAFADDPRMRVAFEQSAAEARKIEGMALRTVTRFVAVPPGQAFDRTAAIERGEAQPRENVGRQALGRLAGRLGGRQQQQEPEAEPELSQTTIMTVTTEIRNVSVANLDAKLFEVPEGYREVQP